MENKWVKISLKKYVLFFLSALILIKLFEFIIGILTSYSPIFPIALIMLFIFFVGMGFIFMGISGFLTGKHLALDPTFSGKYKVEKGQIQRKEIIHYGFFGKMRSSIALIIGVAVLIIEGLTLLSILKK